MASPIKNSSSIPNRPDTGPPKLSWREAHVVARQAMRVEAAKRGGVVLAERRMSYDQDRRIYGYRVRTSRDVSLSGDTNLYIDADSGRVLGLDMPGAGRPGEQITTWLESLHTADAFGWGYNVFVSLVGLAVTVLSVTGVVIWRRKAKARSAQRAMPCARSPAA